MNELRGIDLGDIVPTTVRPLGRRRETAPVYLIEDAAGRRFVLKRLCRTDQGRRGPPMSERLGLEKEIATYRSLPVEVGNRVLVPGLISHGPRHLLLEYVHVSRRPRDAVREDGVETFAQALAQFHWDTPPVTLPWPHELLHNLNHAPAAEALRSASTTLRRQLGLRVARTCVQVILKCRRNQAPLKRSFSSHNDLWGKNVLPAEEGRYYLIDFASRTTGRRWVLDDVVRFGFLTRDMDLARNLIEMYVLELSQRDIHGVNIPVQIRFALLRTILSTLGWQWDFKGSIRAFLEDVLLDDRRFEKWLQVWESPFAR